MLVSREALQELLAKFRKRFQEYGYRDVRLSLKLNPYSKPEVVFTVELTPETPASSLRIVYVITRGADGRLREHLFVQGHYISKDRVLRALEGVMRSAVESSDLALLDSDVRELIARKYAEKLYRYLESNRDLYVREPSIEDILNRRLAALVEYAGSDRVDIQLNVAGLGYALRELLGKFAPHDLDDIRYVESVILGLAGGLIYIPLSEALEKIRELAARVLTAVQQPKIRI